MKLNNTQAFLKDIHELLYIVISGCIAALLPLMYELSPVFVVCSFWTSIPLIYIGFKHDKNYLIMSSLISLLVTLAITVKENVMMFFVFHILPSVIIVYFAKIKNNTRNNINLIILSLTLYASIIGILSSLLFNRTMIDLYYITENFAKQNNLETSYVTPWLSWIPGVFCIGNVIINLINGIIIQSILVSTKQIKNNLFYLKDLTIPDILLLPITISCVGCFFSSDMSLEIISKTLLFTFSFPYLIFSFVTLHLISKKLKNNTILLIVYLLIILLLWPILIMVIVSIFEPWIRLRKWAQE